MHIAVGAANFWWGMIWQDERTYGIIQDNTLSDPTYICQSWCSTEQGLDAVLAGQGLGYGFNTSSAGTQGLCCDNVYVPGSVAQNVISYDVQVLSLCALPLGIKVPHSLDVSQSFLVAKHCTE